MMAVGFSGVMKRADVARAFHLDVKTVTRTRVLDAVVGATADEQFMNRLADSFEEAGPLIFCASISGDGTTDVLNLPFVGLSDDMSHAGRSAWHVMNSLQRFSWTMHQVSDNELSPWFCFEVTRPIVPILSSEKGATLGQSLFGVEQVRSHERFERIGLKCGSRSSLHFDLDGHSANIRMVCIRRAFLSRENGQPPMTTVRHCGNHVQNLIDVAVLSACSSDVVAIMAIGSLFFRMGGNFVRLLHNLPSFLDAKLPIQTLGPPPAGAAIAMDELQDYCIRNYKGFIEDTNHAGWSSDEEGDYEAAFGTDFDTAHRQKRASLKRRHWLYKDSWKEYRGIFNGNGWRDKHATDSPFWEFVYG